MGSLGFERAVCDGGGGGGYGGVEEAVRSE